MKKSSFLTFCFAFVPGAGQMYQGYMKRGLSLITLFCFGIMLSAILSYAAILLPIVWMYSFFDTFNLRNSTQPDAYLIQNEWIESIKDTIDKKPMWIGGGLILAGVWVLFDTFINPLLYRLAVVAGIDNWYYIQFYNKLPTAIFSLVIIYLGFKLAFGKDGKHTKNIQDFEEFKGENFYDDNDQ